MRNRTHTNVAFAVAAAMLLLFLFYVLSTGPAVLLVETGWMSEDSFEVAYFPLIFIAQHCEPIGRALEKYVRLWEVLVE